MTAMLRTLIYTGMISLTLFFLSACKKDKEMEPEPIPEISNPCYHVEVLGIDQNCVMTPTNTGDPYYELYWMRILTVDGDSVGLEYLTTWNLPDSYKLEGTKIHINIKPYSLDIGLTCNALFGYPIVDVVNSNVRPCQ